MRALVTGGAGFIGHHLVRALLREGHEVSVIDDLSTGSIARLDDIEGQVRFSRASILDEDALAAAMDGCEVVFHQAALPSVARSIADPFRSHLVNVDGTMRVMTAAGDAGVRRVVFAGSSSVYGIPASLPCRESMRAAPESPYGVTKLAGEHYVHVLGRLRGVGTVVLRYFNVFGPGQDPASEYAAVVPRFVTAVLEGRRPTINGDGLTSRDFTYIDNVVHANLLAARVGAPSGITCNVACGDRHTLLELLDAIAAAAGRVADPIFGSARRGDIVHSLADISRAQEDLGYEVQVPFDEGILRTVRWFEGVATSSR